MSMLESIPEDRIREEAENSRLGLAILRVEREGAQTQAALQYASVVGASGHLSEMILSRPYECSQSSRMVQHEGDALVGRAGAQATRI